MMTKRDKIKIAILRAINDSDVATWARIKEEVLADVTIRPGGWMIVRNCLQELKDSHTIKKTDSIEIEAYTR